MSQAYADSAHPAGSASALFARGMAARSAGEGMEHAAAAAAGAHCLQSLLMDSSSYSDLFGGDPMAMGVAGMDGVAPLAFLEGFSAMEEEDMWSEMLPRVYDSLPDEYESLDDHHSRLVGDSPMPDASAFGPGPGESTAIAGDLSSLALRGRDHHGQLHHAVPWPSASPSACQPSLQSMMDIVGQDMEMDGMQQLSAGPDRAAAAAAVAVMPEATATTLSRRAEGGEPSGDNNGGSSNNSQAEVAAAAIAMAPMASSKSGGQRGGKAGQNQVNGSTGLQGKDSRWADQLLNQCAVAIATNNVVRTQHLMWVLNDLASLTGDANQRLAAYGLKALFCRVTGSGEATSSSYYNGLEGFNSLTPKAVHKAVLKFHDVSPWHQLVYTVANGALLEAFDGHSRIHVVDIGLSLGTQWPTFMEALATRVSGPPSLLRITLVMDQGVRYNTGAAHNTDSAPASNSSSSEFLLCLERFAKFMGLHVEINTVIGPLQSFNQAALGLRPGEALGVCAQFRLHALSEEVAAGSSSSNLGLLSPRDSFLKVLRSLNPLVLVLSENDVDHLSPDFPTRFAQVTSFFWRFFESNGASYKGKSSEERQIIEYEAAMALLNTVACDGLTRIERNEPHAGWVARLLRGGFSPEPISEDVLDNSMSLLRKYDSHWELLVDMECAVLLWKNQPVTFCSVWTCS